MYYAKRGACRYIGKAATPPCVSTSAWHQIGWWCLVAMSSQVADSLGVHHVVFKAHDGLQASIPIEKALDPYGVCAAVCG